MLEQLLQLDRDLFLALNGTHSPFWDPVMAFFSAKTVWIPLYAAILYGFYHFSDRTLPPRKRWLQALAGVAAVLVCFTLCDRCGAWLKEWVGRPRPAWDPALDGMGRLLEGKGSHNGFPSNHAANTFGLALLSGLIFKRRWYLVLMLLWAAAVSYSRIYVGKHFPLDVVCGTLLGLAVAWGVWLLYRQSCRRWFTQKQ